MSVCSYLHITSSAFFIYLTCLRWFSLFTTNLDRAAHVSLVLTFIASSADVVDFLDYIHNEEIVENLNGITPIMGSIIWSWDTFKTNLTLFTNKN